MLFLPADALPTANKKIINTPAAFASLSRLRKAHAFEFLRVPPTIFNRIAQRRSKYSNILYLDPRTALMLLLMCAKNYKLNYNLR